jgi:hypothetical protein
MTKKYVIETVQVVRRKYYVKVKNPTWAHDGITMGELEHFSDQSLSEEIISTTKVGKFPKADIFDDVNSAVMEFNHDSGEWQSDARWDLA